ncbi:MAG TPA: hypothetical protein VK508_01590 [Cyclobacteriaceae bacterium]|nr:hypothetical protein [Cyclobacteriaceae bacterium]
MRLSNRNILLVIGIVVAVVVTLTTLVYKDRQSAEKQGLPTPKKTSLNSTAQRVIDFISRRVDFPKVPQR